MHEKSGNDTNIAVLQRQWDARLAAEGFVDIERSATGGRLDPYQKTARGAPDNYSADVAEYYRAAGALVQDARFANRREREIWRLHADGLSWNAIVDAIPGTSKHTVQAVVERFRRRIIKRGGQVQRGVHRSGVRECRLTATTTRKLATSYMEMIRAMAMAVLKPARRGRIPQRCFPRAFELSRAT